MSLSSALVRFLFRRSDNRRDAGLSTPEDVLRYDHLRYGPDERWNVLDIYRPKGTDRMLPVIVSVHGGGMVYGDKERYQYYCMSLVKHGFAVVNFSYRLAPEHKYPAALEDTALVFSWVMEHAQEYGLDPENIFAVGDSAGAQLLGLYACRFSNRLKAVALNCGIYRLRKKESIGFFPDLTRDYLPGKGTQEELRQVSVSDLVTSAFPPAFVMTAEGDFLAGQALPFVQKLQNLGVQAEYHYFGDAGHRLGHVFHCNIRLPEAQRCNMEECEFFRRYIQA